MTFTGPIIKNRMAFTQSLEYRFLRTPVNSLPPLQRDTTLEGYDSYTQSDLNLSPGKRQLRRLRFIRKSCSTWV